MNNHYFSYSRFSKSLIVGIFIATLGGCANTQASPKVSAGQTQFVSNTQQIAQVVQALEGGDAKAARKLLKPMQKRDPGNTQFQTLKMSLDADPTNILGKKSFAYIVKRGESMTALSDRFLGDPLKFFLLVRFNGLKDSRLVPGQIIRIPGVAPNSEPLPVTRSRPVPKPTVAAKKPVSAPPVAKSNPVLATTLRGRGLAALNRGSVNEAVATLRKAIAADPGNSAIRRDLERAERLAASVKARK